MPSRRGRTPSRRDRRMVGPLPDQFVLSKTLIFSQYHSNPRFHAFGVSFCGLWYVSILVSQFL
ncbi:uncharacterized protein M6B38_383310 [Iris pallida]|uniref:Uncharacterized protein n=1 Tax=Iris pallida TaxID=29817 RepID=A0AAX6G4X3_IRIPA|nr:uncharacterized protein M6B38_383310 [Iris pallida]